MSKARSRARSQDEEGRSPRESPRQLVTILCRAVLKHHHEIEETKQLSNPLKLSHISLYRDRCHDNKAVINRLFRMVYDIILLRKSEWSGRWSSPLSPDSRCLSHMYFLTSERDRDLLTHSVSVLMEYENCGAIFGFLSNLAKPLQEVCLMIFMTVAMV